MDDPTTEAAPALPPAPDDPLSVESPDASPRRAPGPPYGDRPGSSWQITSQVPGGPSRLVYVGTFRAPFTRDQAMDAVIQKWHRDGKGGSFVKCRVTRRDGGRATPWLDCDRFRVEVPPAPAQLLQQQQPASGADPLLLAAIARMDSQLALLAERLTAPPAAPSGFLGGLNASEVISLFKLFQAQQPRAAPQQQPPDAVALIKLGLELGRSNARSSDDPLDRFLSGLADTFTDPDAISDIADALRGSGNGAPQAAPSAGDPLAELG